MSDVKRLAAALGRALKKYPRQRVGQIISNAMNIADGPGGDPDIFYYEDEELIRAVERYAGGEND